MSARTPADPVAGRAFFRGGPLYACVLVPPAPGDPRRSAALAFEFAADRYAAALEFARHAGGRNPMMLVERIAPGSDAWPTREPTAAASFLVERGGCVVLAPSVEAWVAMPPSHPHHLVQLVAAGDEAAARAALAALDGCGFVARVRAVLLGDSGAEIDAVVGDANGLRAGWFATTPSTPTEAVVEHASPAPPEATTQSRSHDPRTLLDDALAAYCTPFPRPTQLDAWLATHAPCTDPSSVRASLDALLATTSDLLWDQSPAVAWTDDFAALLFEHGQSRHPWLGEAARAPLLAYAKWLAWHEGLTSPAAE